VNEAAAIRSHGNRFRIDMRPPRNPTGHEHVPCRKSHPFTLDREYENNMKIVGDNSDALKIPSRAAQGWICQ